MIHNPKNSSKRNLKITYPIITMEQCLPVHYGMLQRKKRKKKEKDKQIQDLYAKLKILEARHMKNNDTNTLNEILDRKKSVREKRKIN